MAINIQNLINEINNRLTLADSSDAAVDRLRLEKIVKNATATSGVLEYGSVNALPDIDSSTIGSIAYVTDTKFDGFGTFYSALNTGWERITLTADSDEDSYEFTLYYPGENYGYTSGGNAAPVILNTISKFSFTSDGNAADVGTLTQTSDRHTGVSSKFNAYAFIDGATPGIDKFSFASEGASTTIGNMTQTSAAANEPGNSSMAYDAGYRAGGQGTDGSRIEKVSFAVDENSTDVGSLTVARSIMMGSSSQEYGYNSGALDPVTSTETTIDKFIFSSNAYSTDVGDLTQAMFRGTGLSSITHGYAAGNTRNVDKFPFASDANATSIGSIFSTLDGSLFQYSAGHSSMDYGYISGGLKPTKVNHIEKFPFVSETSSTNVGDLIQPVHNHAGHHV